MKFIGKLLIILFTCLSTSLYAQTHTFTQLDWGVMKIDSLLPVYTELVPLEGDYSTYSYEVRLEYPQYEELNAVEAKKAKELAPSLPAHPEVNTSVGVSRGRGYIDIEFVPVVQQKGKYYKLVSCKIAIHKTPTKSSARRLQSRAGATQRYASQSVLSTGKWVKIAISSDGVYQLTATDLRSMGFSNPENVRLYGYGGHLQSELIDADEDYDDLEEVPLFKGANGWLFYGNGVVSWDRSNTSMSAAKHKVNNFSRYAYYFLTEGTTPTVFPKESSSSTTDYEEVENFTDYALHEKDEYAWYHGGRQLFESYNYAQGNTQSYTLSTPDAVTTASANLVVSFSASEWETTLVTPTINGTVLGAFALPALSDYEKATSRTKGYTLTSLKPTNGSTTVKLKTTEGHNARLDYIELAYTRKLQMSTSHLVFSTPMSKAARFNITTGTGQDVRVWRLGKRGEPVTEIAGTQNGKVYSVTVDNPGRTYVAVNVNGTFPSPTVVGQVANQNLHGTKSEIDMVIIVPSAGQLTAQAQRLAQAHVDKDGLRVQVVSADKIYNEFSSGTPDATAYRRYLKMLYDRAQDGGTAPRYLLLFGDAAWDNRMLSIEWRNCTPNEFLLCYESENSFSETNCYVMEDYFGLLDDGEGGNLVRDKVDLGVGRFPVRTASEASIMVNKTIDYMQGAHDGLWKNIVCMLGDDGDKNEHMEMANNVAVNIERNNPELEVRKFMWDAYPRESGITGNTYPLIRKQILEQMEEGALMMNYTGHAITYCLSPENVLRIEDFRTFSSKRLPLWVTAACDVMPFDAQIENIGETAVLNPKGAAVAFYGTARTVYANYNYDMNRNFTKFLFGCDEDGERNRLGDAVRLSKMAQSATNKLHYALLGDPALVIGAPKNQVVLDCINGEPLDQMTDTYTLKAGSLARFSGRILNSEGEQIKDFTGVLSARVFDSEGTVVCLNNEGKSTTPFTFQSRDKILFHGNDSVVNGEFSFTFSVPIDINYSDEGGRVVFYAISNDKKQEANGYNEQFLVGGSSNELAADKQGPSITGYLNNPDFMTGGTVNATPYFVASLEDESGINTTNNGIGHNLELSIDGNPNTTYNLNEYYTNDFGDFRRGSVAFSIPELNAGVHVLKFRAWDVLNNSSTMEMAFHVDKALKPRLGSISVSNNPAKEHTTFYFYYDRPGSTCTFTIEVFDFTGRLLWTHTENGVSNTGIYAVPWNLTTGGGMPLHTGVYLYRATISCGGSEEATKAQKLIISRNK